MSNLLQVLTMMAAPACLFLTLRSLNLRDARVSSCPVSLVDKPSERPVTHPAN